MAHYRQSTSARKFTRGMSAVRRRATDQGAGQGGDDGVTLLEVVVAFVILMISLIPLSYLFTNALISAGQSTNQQTALSIAEKWVEVLENTTPPVNSYGEVVVDTSGYPQGPAPSSATSTAAGSSVGANLDAVSTINLASSANFAAATTSVPQTVEVTTGTTTQATTSVSYSAISGNTLTCTTNPCSTTSAVMSSSSSDPIAQATVATPTETKGSTVYTLQAKYSWAVAQNSGAASPPDLCTSGTPQLLKLTVNVSWGPNADGNNIQDSTLINYPPTGVQTLGFIALQMSGDTGASDTQSPSHPWSYRVQSIPVKVAGQQSLPTLYPDSYGCVFAQVLPGSYSISVGQPANGYPTGTTYASPEFVANATGSVTNHVWSPPTCEPQPACTSTPGSLPTVNVAIGAVTRVTSTLSSDYPGFDQATTVNLNYPSSTAVEDGVTCPGAGTITCVATGENSSGTAAVTWANGSSWSTATIPSAVSVTRISSMACPTSTTCIAVGYGSGGAVILNGSGSASPQLTADSGSAIPSGSGADLTQVVCPSTTQCVALGTTSTGTGVVLSGTISSGGDVWTQETIPAGIAALSSLVCPTSATGCAAIADTTSGGTPLVITGPAGAGTWAAGTSSGFTLTSLTQIACPTSTTCMAIGSGKIGSSTTVSPVVLSAVVTGGTGLGSTGSTVAWAADTLTSTTVTQLGQIVCPVTTKCLITGVGTYTAGSTMTTGGLLLYGPTAGPLKSEFPVDVSAPISAITEVTCPTSTNCTLIGSSSGTAVIFTGTINGTNTAPDTWNQNTVPSSSVLSQVVCPSASSCLVMATGTSASNPQGLLFYTTNSGTNWYSATLPASDSMQYFDGISCVTGGTGTCSAVGATPTGSVVLTTSTGPGGSWSDQTPSGLSGYSATGIPLEISNNNGLLPSAYINAVTAGANPNATQLPAVYPLTQQYSLFAGDCSTEANAYNTSSFATIPGGITGVTAGLSSPTVPLGLLPVQVVHKSGVDVGQAYAGATLTITATTASCNADNYTIQTAGADGLSRTQVPYGTYNIFVNGSATAAGTVTVAGVPSQVTVSA